MSNHLLGARAARRTAALVLAGALLSGTALAQTTTTFFMVFKGRITANATVTPRPGDIVIAKTTGASAQTSLDGTLQFQGLNVTKQNNTATPVTFTLRQGSATYTLVSSAGDTQAFSTDYAGYNNPLSAAFAAQTVNLFIGPSTTGGGGNGDGDGEDQGDPLDVDGSGTIDTADATLVLRFIVGNREGVTDAAALDVNGDGRITTDDVVLILRHNGEAAQVPASTSGTTS